MDLKINGKGIKAWGNVNCKIFLLSALFVFSMHFSYGSHSSGSDLQYTWISGRTYQVTVSFYRDCAGVAAPANITLNAFSATCGSNQNYTLNQVAGTGVEITFPCRTVQTICTNSGSPYAGYQLYQYTNTVTLPQNCSDWKFSYYVCCRNCAITTLNNPCSDNLYVEATLDNLTAPTNSSPQFTNVPVAFLCTNQGFTYNHGVYDPDGDSLSYSFVAPMTYNSGNSTVGTVSFISGYSASQPLTSSPAVTINPVNGDINMFPTVTGEIGATAILIREYRNGVQIGSVVRDMQFLTKACNPNVLPTATGINGSNVFSITVCPGSTLSFNVNSNDLNATDTVTMVYASGIPTASFTNNGARLPVGTFTWTPTLADARSQPYSMIVTVRDNACPTNGSQTYSYSITVPKLAANATSPTVGGYNIACNGANTGSATVTYSGGSAPYSFLWNPSAQITQTATNLSPGNYTVTVTDGNGCTKNASVTLNEPPTAPAVVIGSSTNVSCNGGSDGLATASASGGLGSYTYLWTPTAQSTVTASNLTAGVYTVRITDSNGCTAQQGVSITQPAVLNASVLSFQNVSCRNNANGSINVIVGGGNAPYTHHWSNGATTASITGLAAATYVDTVRDSKGCATLLSHTITQPGSIVSLPSSSVTASNVSCFGLSDGSANVNPVGGTPAYTVTWSNGDVGNSADSLSGGLYTVHIVDGNGCTFDSTISITEPSLLTSAFTNYSLAPSGNNIDCFGNSNGKVKIQPSGGTPPYSYSWTNGSLTDSISGVPAGSYTVQVTDQNGCVVNNTATINEPPAALNDILDIRNVGCKGESSGGIRVDVTGGSAPYSYTWSHGPFVTDTVGDLFAGFYQVTITDVNNCQRIDTVTIQEPNVIVPLISTSSFIGAVNVVCHGDATGSATLNVMGGTPPYSYQWSTGDTASSIGGLAAGIVTVRVEDSNGCSMIIDTALTEPPAFAFAPTVSHPNCYGDNSGYLVLNTSGSVGPYTYTWSSGQTTDSVANLTSGNYSVIIEDANSCADTISFTLTDPDSITAHATVSDFNGYNISCFGANTGTIQLNPTGGDGTFTYLWNNSATTANINSLITGVYDVTITDGRGCTRDTSLFLTEPLAVNANVSLTSFNGTGVSCNGYADGMARAVVSGGVAPYTYLWSNGDVLDSAMGLTAGAYTLMVTDSNGCNASVPFTMTQPTPVLANPSLSSFNGYNVSCFGDSSGCITINPTGGFAPYTFEWDVNDTITSQTLCNLSAGSYLVRVVDANGCRVDTVITLNTPTPVITSTQISNYNGFQIQCNGMSNGTVNLTVSGGVTPYTYAWSTGATSQNISGLNAGSYSVIVTDGNGCSDTSAITMNEPQPVVASISMTPVSCRTDNGTATLAPTSGTAPFSYLWNSVGQTSATAVNLPAGWHTGTVTDNSGCSVTDSIYVDSIPMMSLNFSNIVSNDCPGNEVGGAQIDISGGLPPFSYQWPNGVSGNVNTSLPGGNVTVTVTDASGCSVDVATVIPEIGGCQIELPNGFSPNGDGYNDGYVIKNIEGYPDNYFQVYNRWGNIVFRRENYANPDWIGQNMNGEELPEGTYFVIVELRGLNVKKNTYVDLRRFTTR